MKPSKFQIVKLENELQSLKQLRKALDQARLRCGSLNQRIETVRGKRDQLRDWQTECEMTGSC